MNQQAKRAMGAGEAAAAEHDRAATPVKGSWARGRGPWASAVALGLGLCVFGGAGDAQAIQPLSEIFASARSKGLENKEAAATAAQRDAEADQAWGRVLPALTGRAAYTRNENEAVLCQKAPPLTCTDAEKVTITPKDQLEASISLEVPLVDVAGWSRVGAARATAKAASARALATAQDVDRALAQRYFQAIAAQSLVDAAKRAVAAAEASQKVASARQGAGATSSLEVDRAAAEVARATQSVADAELLKAVSRRAIESLSGLKPSDGAPALAEDLKDEAPLDTWEGGAKQTPLVLAAKLDSEAADKQKTAAWAALLPTISATATERATNATGFSGKVGSYALGLTATWRLDLVGIRGVSVQGAAADGSKIRAEKAERDAKDKVFEAYQQVVAQVAKSKAARAQVTAATKAAEIARERYSLGAGTQIDAIVADRDAFQAEVSRIQADADLAYARVALRLAAGKPLDGVKAAAGGAATSGDKGAASEKTSSTDKAPATDKDPPADEAPVTDKGSATDEAHPSDKALSTPKAPATVKAPEPDKAPKAPATVRAPATEKAPSNEKGGAK